MHRIFTITELIANICDHLPFPSLVPFALTQKECLSPVALEQIWVSQVSLLPLLKTLPEDAWRADQTVAGDFHLLRPLTPSDWRRPRVVARHIKALHHDDGHDRLSPQHATAITAILEPSEPLIPRLRDLSFAAKSGTLPWLKLLLRQGGNVLRLELDVDSVTAGAVFFILKAASCPLQSLLVCFRGNEEDADEIRTISDAASDMLPSLTKTLSFASIAATDSMVLLSLSLLPQLRRLDVSITDSHPPNFPVRPFPKLDELTVFASDIAVPASLLRVLKWKLHKLWLTLELPTAAGLDTLFATAEDACLGELQSLNLSIGNAADHEVPPVAFCDLRRFFFNFELLVDVTVDISGKLDVDDARAWEIARAWPLVRYLCLTGSSTATPDMTLAALLAFATHCPDLADLHLAVDACAVPEIAEGMPKLSRLQAFFPLLPSTLPPDVRPVANFLSNVFPDGVILRGRSASWRDVWKKLKKHLR